MINQQLSVLPSKLKKIKIPSVVLDEAKKRVLDSLGCFYGAFEAAPIQILRSTLTKNISGPCSLWGKEQKVSSDVAAWVNGASVRALDFNDTYLSKEPCHPSDLISSFWAACEIKGGKDQGRTLLEAMVLGYDVMARLCDANSLRLRGWDHVTYLPIASAVGCSYIFGLTPEKTHHAIALSMIGNNAMRQTRVGTISDWKASCAAYAAKTGLWAVQLADQGFTGPSDIFSGPNAFFKQVSGEFSLPLGNFGTRFRMMDTHTKFFPAEHHAQSAIEAALEIRDRVDLGSIKEIRIDCFDVAVQIIGSEKEKWAPTTRETADHSMPYLVVAALLDGDVTLKQFKDKKYLSPVVRKLLGKVTVKSDKEFTRLYPKKMPSRVSVIDKNGTQSARVFLPKGYAGRPMSWDDEILKFSKMASSYLSDSQMRAVISTVSTLDRCASLSLLSKKLKI